MHLPELIYRYLIFNLKPKRLEDNHLENLKSKGFSIINEYIDGTTCDQLALATRELMGSYPNFVQQKDDRRLFGIENLDKRFELFGNDLYLSRLASTINRSESSVFFVLGGWLKAGNLGSSGQGWHRDAFFSQFKCMLYLTDVDKNTGPFEIIPGSHRMYNVLKTQFLLKKISSISDRFSDREIALLKDKGMQPFSVCGGKGTLLLFNSTTIHRGSPIESGERITATAYFYENRKSKENINSKFKVVNPNQ